MRKNPFSEKKWAPMAMAICIGVLFYYLLEHIGVIWSIIVEIGYFVYPVVAGLILAYLINPLMRWVEAKIFKKIRKEKMRDLLSLITSLVIVIAFISLIIGTLVPQLYDSIVTLYGNREGYIAALSEWITEVGGDKVLKNFEGLFSASRNLIEYISKYVTENSEEIASGVAKFGGHIGSWLIGIVFSVYFLAGKNKVNEFGMRIISLIQKNPDRTARTLTHIKKIDSILTRYLAFSIIDGIIVGAINALFMAIVGMQYTGLVSVIVGVTNLVPTFGPVIGALIGLLILILTDPMHALYFLIFTLILQTIDGYILKPKLFGETFGISGLWILIAIIVGGRIFGVIGIVLAIPFVAIGDYLIRNVIMAPHTAKETAPGDMQEHNGGDQGE